jgi:hypothetical protein
MKAEHGSFFRIWGRGLHSYAERPGLARAWSPLGLQMFVPTGERWGVTWTLADTST